MINKKSAISKLKITCLSVLVIASLGNANAWTKSTVKVIVPAVAGGTMDIAARVLADQLSKDIGAPVVVENKRGAGGNVAVNSLLAAAADGQTIMITNDNILTEIPHVIKQNFSLEKDIRPVAAFASSGFVLVGAEGLPAKNFAELLEYLKANPKRDSFASYAVGSASHYSGLMFSDKAGLKLQHIPFVGSPPALLQVMSGDVPIMVDGVATSLSLIRGKKLRPYAVVSKRRMAALPDVPTFLELGYPEINFSNQMVAVVPSGVSIELSEKIRSAIYKSASAEAVKKRLSDFGLEPLEPQSIEAIVKYERGVFDRIGGIIKDYKLNVGQ